MMPTAITGSYPRPLWFTDPYLLQLQADVITFEVRREPGLSEACMRRLTRRSTSPGARSRAPALCQYAFEETRSAQTRQMQEL